MSPSTDVKEKPTEPAELATVRYIYTLLHTLSIALLQMRSKQLTVNTLKKVKKAPAKRIRNLKAVCSQ